MLFQVKLRGFYGVRVTAGAVFIFRIRSGLSDKDSVRAGGKKRIRVRNGEYGKAGEARGFRKGGYLRVVRKAKGGDAGLFGENTAVETHGHAETAAAKKISCLGIAQDSGENGPRNA